jgi:hypothetical protein
MGSSFLVVGDEFSNIGRVIHDELPDVHTLELAAAHGTA